MTCRYDRDADDYLADTPDGPMPCRHDEWGDPTYHCTARRSCTQHVGRGELTCARCVGRVRQDIRQIVELAALIQTEAVVAGVNSEAAYLAGPVADPEAWMWHQIERKKRIEERFLR